MYPNPTLLFTLLISLFSFQLGAQSISSISPANPVECESILFTVTGQLFNGCEFVESLTYFVDNANNEIELQVEIGFSGGPDCTFGITDFEEIIEVDPSEIIATTYTVRYSLDGEEVDLETVTVGSCSSLDPEIVSISPASPSECENLLFTVNGERFNGCEFVESLSYTVDNVSNEIDLTVTIGNTGNPNCTFNISPFQDIIEVDASEIGAGTYTVRYFLRGVQEDLEIVNLSSCASLDPEIVSIAPQAPSECQNLFFTVNGELFNGCQFVQSTSYTVDNVSNEIDLTVTIGDTGDPSCTFAITPFEETIEVNASEINAGTYTVRYFLRGVQEDLEFLAIAPCGPISFNNQLIVINSNPSECTDLQVLASGEFSNACYEAIVTSSQSGNFLNINMTSNQVSTTCPQVVTPWQSTRNFGELAPGTYQVRLFVDGELVDTESVTVASCGPISFNNQLTVLTSNPSECTDLLVQASGEFPDACYQAIVTSSQSGNLLNINMTSNQVTTTCPQVVTPWQSTRNFGELAPGTYQVRLFVDGELAVSVSVTVVSCGPFSFNNQLTVLTADPSECTDLRVQASGEFPDACYQAVVTSSQSGNTLTITMTSQQVTTTCPQVVTPWQSTQNFGQLAPGTYQAILNVDGVIEDVENIVVDDCGSISVSPPSQTVEAEADCTTFTVTSTGAWTANASSSWISSVTPSSGAAGSTVVTVCYTDNASTNSRTGTVTFSGAGLSASATINQSGESPSIALDPIMQTVDAVAGCTTVSLTANVPWSASSSDGWINSIFPSSGGAGATVITICYDANMTGDNRTGNISFLGSGVSSFATIIQEGIPAMISVDPPVQSVGSVIGCTTFEVTASTNWVASFSASWINGVFPNTGSAGTTTVTVCYNENDEPESRTGEIAFTAGNAMATGTVIQNGSGPFLNVTPPLQEVDALAGCATFLVTTSENWTASSTSPWINSIAPQSGAGGSTEVSVCYAEHTGAAVRTATVEFNASTVNTTATVQQAGSTNPDGDADGFLATDDCDDTNPDINPLAIEIPGNTADEDCDGFDGPISTQELSFVVDAQSVCPGDTLELPITVLNFEDITSFQFSLALSRPGIGRIVGIVDQSAGVGTFDSTIEDDSITARVVWIGTDPLTLADGTTFLSVRIIAEGPVGNCSLVSIVNSPISIFATESLQGIPVNVETYSGAFCICSSVSVSGDIQTFYGTPVPNVEVSVHPDYPVQITDLAGQYGWSELQRGLDYEVTPMRNDNPLNGVNVGDIVRIRQHILGTSFASPYQVIAADVDRANGVNVGDIFFIRQLILNRIQEFPNNTSWRFVPEEHVFANPQNPVLEIFPESLVLGGLSTDIAMADFVAMKVGDVDSSSVADNLVEPEPLTLELEDRWLQAGEEVTLALRMSRDFAVKGLQLVLDIDREALTFEEVETQTLSNFDAQQYHFDDGQLRVLWFDATPQMNGLPLTEHAEVLLVNLRANQAGQLSEWVKLREQNFVVAADNQLHQVTLSYTELTNTGNWPLERSAFELVIQPNPVQDRATIQFQLPEAQEVTFILYDATGKELYRRAEQLPAGATSWSLDLASISASGLLYYQAVGKGSRLSGKIIVQQ